MTLIVRIIVHIVLTEVSLLFRGIASREHFPSVEGRRYSWGRSGREHELIVRTREATPDKVLRKGLKRGRLRRGRLKLVGIEKGSVLRGRVN